MQKQYRLKKREDYKKVYAKGKTFACKYMVLCFSENLRLKNQHQPDGLKIGFSVSGKVGKAHLRNRIRRQMKEAARLLIPHIKPSCKIIISARTTILEATYKQINDSIIYMLKKSGLWIS